MRIFGRLKKILNNKQNAFVCICLILLMLVSNFPAVNVNAELSETDVNLQRITQLDKEVINTEKEQVKLHATFDESSEVVEGTLLSVTEVNKDFVDYDNYKQRAAHLLNSENYEYRFFTISFAYNNEKVLPTGITHFSIERNNNATVLVLGENDGVVSNNEFTNVFSEENPSLIIVFAYEKVVEEVKDYEIKVGYKEEEIKQYNSFLSSDEIKENSKIKEEAEKYASFIKDKDDIIDDYFVEYLRLFKLNEVKKLETEEQLTEEIEKKISESKINVEIKLINYNLTDEIDTLRIVTFKGEEKKIIEPKVEKKEKDLYLNFEVEHVDAFAIVDTKKEVTLVSRYGNEYQITATYNAKSGIPANAVLAVSEVIVTVEQYEDVINNASEKASEENVVFVRAFDITIRDYETDEEYQPNTNVKISIDLINEIIDETVNVDVLHIHEEKETQLIDSTVEGETVEFTTDGFSVFVVLGTTVEKKLTASDGNNYLISVTYDNSSNIPEGVELVVNEISEDDEKYSQYVAQSAQKVGGITENVVLARAFDITLKDPNTGEEYQPTNNVKVTIKLLNENLNEYSNLDVVHFHGEADEEAEIMETNVNGGSVEFSTNGFSVYVVISHEGGEIITPRVEFHFLDKDYTEDSENPGTYTASPFYFINKAETEQNSEIVKTGEALELITNPANVEIDNGDGTFSYKYFFGWYIVDEASKDSSGKVTYTWPTDPEQLIFEKSVTIDPNKIVWANAEHTAITSFVWELNGVEHTVSASNNSSNRVVLDEYGCAHVYLAPIYQDYYFVNFHAGTQDSELGNSIISRKLVVLGSDGKTEVRIGDVQATSADTQHKIFTGWEGQLWDEQSGAITTQEMITLDETGEEYNSGPDKDGFYITVDSHVLYPGKLSVDLYPIYTEARWFHFRTGGSGSTYVGDTYVYTTNQPSDVEDGSARFYLTDLPTSSRTGYRFKGWFADATEVDSNGDYIDGYQIADENGQIINISYTKYDSDGVTPLYQLKDGRLYAYKDIDALSGITLYAHWEEITDATIQVIIWRQKVTDSKDAYDYQKTYDFEASYTIDTTSGLTLSDLQANNVLRDYENAERYVQYVDSNANFTGFHYRTTLMNTSTVKGDGGTIVNVYYDRDLMTIYFYYQGNSGATAYTYSPTTGNNTPQFGIVEGEYVELVRKSVSGTEYKFRYVYQETTSDTITPQYALVSYTDGTKLYEELTRDTDIITNTRWRFRTGNGLQKTTRYMDQGVTDGFFYVRSGRNYVNSGYTVTSPPEDTSTTYYCYYNYRYYELTPQSTTTTIYSWKLNGDVYSGKRYRRLASQDEYSGDVYTDNVDYFGIDNRGGFVELDGTTVSGYKWYTTTHADDYILDNDNDGTLQDVYGLVNDQYVILTPSAGGNYSYLTLNTYTASTGSNALYGLVNGEYVQLTRNTSYSYNRTGYTYTYSDDDDGTQYGIVDGNIQQVYYHWPYWRETDSFFGDRYRGYHYTRTNSNNNSYSGQLYVVISGTAGNNNSGFTPTDLVSGNNLYGKDANNNIYFQLRATENIYYTYRDNNNVVQTYTGTRYFQGPGENWTGNRYTRTGSVAPYTYTLLTENPTTGQILYAQDNNVGDAGDALNGHVRLDWSADISGYTYEDSNGVIQQYFGDRYTHRSGEIEAEYTGTRYTRTTPGGNYNRMLMYTGLYGQTLAQAGYTWPDRIGNSNYIWYSSTGNNRSRLTFLDAFLFADLGYATNNNTVLTLYGSTTSQTGTYIYFYKQNLDGTYPALGYANASNAIPTTSGGSFSFTNKYNGFELDVYSNNNGSSWNTANVDGSASISSSGLHIRFKRNNYELIFDPNYPKLAGTTINGTEVTLDNISTITANNTVTQTVPFETPLSTYSNQSKPTETPDNYTFTGWYVDATCTQKYDFSDGMPSANMRLYAGWSAVRFRIKIDPNGGEFDHINHKWNNESENLALRGYADSGAGWWWVDNGDDTQTAKQYSATEYNSNTWTPFANFNRGEILAEDGTVERAADTGWAATSRYSTYINARYMDSITEYTNMKNEYVPISDAFAETYNGAVYYYMNAQFQSDAIDGSGLPSANRSALYLTESELHEYYLFYANWVKANLIGGYISGTTVLDEETWRATYVSTQKYRHTIGSENYTFLGWYKLDENGNPETMPYNFSDPVKGSFTLKAYWRLDAGYQIRYHADYTTDEGVIINGSIPYWTDPEISAARYADEAATHIYRQPTGITANNQPTTDYIFRGWRLVNISTNSQGQVVYTPIENNVFYDPGDDFTIHAAYADRSSVIHMQAVYEKIDSSYRRPYITNLTLNANGGFITMDGENELEINTDLSSTWNGVIGTVAATVDNEGVDTELIEFGDIQSNEKVQLYRYATDLTHVDGDDNKAVLDPAGKNYFKHPDNYLLLGFDEESNEGDYVATYPADSVIAAQRNEEKTLYAVWEPMVYVKVVNDTGKGPVTFGLSSAEGALQVVNARNGLFDRTPMSASELSSITVEDGDYTWLAIPYGVVKEVVGGNTVLTKRHITIEGTNNLGPGWMLSASSELNGTVRTLTGSLTNTEADYTEVHNLNQFGFSEQLELDPNGIVITFTAIQNPHTLELDDNYPNVGVRTQEVYFNTKENTGNVHGYDIVYGQNKTLYYDLPTTSTRIGYIFLGWDPDPNWASTHDVKTEKPAYTTDGATGWRINSLNEFFTEGDEFKPVKTLYAVWDNSADAQTVFVYKEVPEPGDLNKEFTFTVSLSGRYDYSTRNNDYSGSFSLNDKVFVLKNGEYLRIYSSKVDSGSGTWNPSVTTLIEKYDKNGVKLSSTTMNWNFDYTINSSSGTYRSFNFRDLAYQVTESDYSSAPNYYDTTLNCTALASDTYPLNLGDTPVRKDDLPLEGIESRTLKWANTEAGGTVVFTNTRQTADITIKKELISNTTTAGIFNYTASYLLDGETTDLGSFTVTSGTNGKVLEKIPVGAKLTVTEVGSNLNDYITTVKQGNNDLTINETTENVNSTTTYKRSVNYDVVKGDTTITWTNTLKSYPITFYKVDQDGHAGVPSYFRLSSSTGLIAEQLYPLQTGTGEFFPGTSGLSNKFYVGTYTLTETFVGENFLPLEGPVTLTVSSDNNGKLTSSNTDYVKIEQVDNNDPTKGFKVYVYNQKIVKLKIRKVLSDPILTSTKQFSFRVQYEYQLLGRTVTYDNNDNLLKILSGSEAEIKVPVNAKLTITEVLSDADRNVYDTDIVRSYKDGTQTKTDTKVNGTVYKYSNETGSNHGVVLAENDGDMLTFTNTRQRVDITIKKLIDNYSSDPDNNYFTFTTTLLNGLITIKDCVIDLNGTPNDASDDLKTDNNGRYVFHLKHNENKKLSIPKGARLTIQETGASSTNEFNEDVELSDYAATVTAVYDENQAAYNDGVYDEYTMLYDLNPMPAKALTVTFTNGPAGTRRVILRKVDTDYVSKTGGNFTLYVGTSNNPYRTKTDEVLDNMVANNKGIIWVGELPYGTYYLKESVRPGETGVNTSGWCWYYLIINDDGKFMSEQYGTRAQATEAARNHH